MRFRTTVEQAGRTATGLEVPAEVVDALGAGKRAPVSITLGAYVYRTTLAVMGGRHLVPLAAEHRTAAGVAAGDEVEVDIALDAAPRTVEVPADLAAALAEAGLRERFDELAFSARKEHVRSVESAKAEATRARRVQRIVDGIRPPAPE
ncbi:YdeI/OmpD-associated family protein [Pseudonocardia xishanensis]|uniref:Bacteriocin resistance YdeI/OmpD-like protein n=1 Tax=Pseudonocardia xishanensis TaxID=630995 RepID=A0ABP8RQ08_9PSEU